MASSSGVFNATALTLSDGQEGRVALDVNGNTKVLTMGAQAMETGQVTIGTTATAIIGGRKRSRVRITSHAATAVFIGGAGVTTANGYRLPATDGASVVLETSAAIYAIVAAGTLVVSFLDEYNV